jgi:hypothetical protein
MFPVHTISSRTIQYLALSRSCGWLASGNRQKISSSPSFSSFSHLQFISHPTPTNDNVTYFFLCSTVRMANSNIAYSILWLIVLWCIAWPIAGFAAGFWILIQVCLTWPKVPCVIFCHSQSCSVIFPTTAL